MSLSLPPTLYPFLHPLYPLSPSIPSFLPSCSSLPSSLHSSLFYLSVFSLGDSFDIADRTFRNMGTTWWLSSSESTTDVKELIPEFFFLPEFLTNAERMLISESADIIMMS